MSNLSASELILNPDGSIFHLSLHPGQLSEYIFLVGDPARVELVGTHLEHPERLASNREFHSLSGLYHGRRVTVLSTGIGTDNIDIVLNELDALANIDLELRQEKERATSLKLIRIGTSGSIRTELEAGAFLASAWSLGLDGLMHYYNREEDPERTAFEAYLEANLDWNRRLPFPYVAKASAELLECAGRFAETGITVSAHGFYGPQGRQIRAGIADPGLHDRLLAIEYGGYRVTNFEMESSALYGLAGMLGHEALTVCLIIANRTGGKFLGDYKASMHELVEATLNSVLP